MKEADIKNDALELEKLYDKLDYYYNMLSVPQHPYQRAYVENLIIKDVSEALKNVKRILASIKGEKDRQEKFLTLDELKNFDGGEGRPAYVAVDGIIYDVSMESSWGGATHFGSGAGVDLTKEFNTCHTDKTVLLKLPVVGKLI